MRKIILSLSTALLASTPAWAINCQVETNCTTLGYTSSKDEGNCLKCPFGNQWACLKTDTSCPEDSSGSNCNVGDILYSDMTCSSDVITSKTPIAVVSDTTNSLAFALEEENKSWSTTLFDVPNLTNVEITGKEDWEGKENTQTIVKYCSNNMKSCPAVEYISSYKTVGTSAGDWYLPALGELQAIYENMLILNYGLSKIYGTASRKIPTDNYYHWSSTESGGQRAGIWALYFANREARQTNKSLSGYILPVIKY